MRLSRLILVLALLVAVVAGTWGMGNLLFKPNAQQEFRDRLRLPQYIPEYLRRYGSTEASTAGGFDDRVKPGVAVWWEGRVKTPLDRSGYTSPGVMMTQVGLEFDFDIGGERESVDVDGVSGWLIRLDSEDFRPPLDGTPIYTLARDWPEGAGRGASYNRVIGQRDIPGPRELPPITDEASAVLEEEVVRKPLVYVTPTWRPWQKYTESRGVIVEVPEGERWRWSDSLLWGPAIALQWNRDGVHHLLIAQDIEPMNETELFRMANSMAPSKYPSGQR